MPVTLLTDNFDKIQRPVVKKVELFPGTIVPVTKDGKCPFLKDDLGCAVYDQRPHLCVKFGDETHPQMTCGYQTKDGKARDQKEKRKILEVQRKETDIVLGRKK